MSEEQYREKYLKYKNKYLDLKNIAQDGGMFSRKKEDNTNVRMILFYNKSTVPALHNIKEDYKSLMKDKKKTYNVPLDQLYGIGNFYSYVLGTKRISLNCYLPAVLQTKDKKNIDITPLKTVRDELVKSGSFDIDNNDIIHDLNLDTICDDLNIIIGSLNVKNNEQSKIDVYEKLLHVYNKIRGEKNKAVRVQPLEAIINLNLFKSIRADTSNPDYDVAKEILEKISIDENASKIIKLIAINDTNAIKIDNIKFKDIDSAIVVKNLRVTPQGLTFNIVSSFYLCDGCKVKSE